MMSIIAEALKKAEVASGAPADPPPPRSAPLWIYRAALVGCVAVVLLGIAQFTHRPARAVIPSVSAQATPAPAGTPVQRLLQLAQNDLALSGIIRSEDGRSLALINNQVIQQGDQIRGMRVVQVNSRSVEIQDGGGKTRTLQLKD